MNKEEYKKTFERLDKYVFSKDYEVKDDWYYLLNYHQQEISKLQTNWNELKEYCKNNYYGTTTVGILDKMQELEEGKDE